MRSGELLAFFDMRARFRRSFDLREGFAYLGPSWRAPLMSFSNGKTYKVSCS